MNRVIDKIFDFLRFIYRRKSWPRIVFGSGVACVVASVTGGISFVVDLLVRLVQPTTANQVANQDWLAFLPVGCFMIGVLLIASGGVAGFIDWRNERKEKSRQYAIVVELRGLRVSHDVPVEEADALSSMVGRHTIMVDVRNQLDEGRLSDPGLALRRVTDILPSQLLSSIEGKKAKDIQLAFGGMAAVPLTFLAGVLIDDESQVMRLEWNRHDQSWRELSEPDDLHRFEIIAVRDSPGASTLALCISFSYPIETNAVLDLLPDAKLVEFRLPAFGVDGHWSGKKQAALAKQFLDTLVAHANFTEIHIFLAAPSSFAFLLGQCYDKRNLPPARVYQYERGQIPVFPWAVSMPVAGKSDAEVIWTNERLESCA